MVGGHSDKRHVLDELTYVVGAMFPNTYLYRWIDMERGTGPFRSQFRTLAGNRVGRPGSSGAILIMENSPIYTRRLAQDVGYTSQTGP